MNPRTLSITRRTLLKSTSLSLIVAAAQTTRALTPAWANALAAPSVVITDRPYGEGIFGTASYATTASYVYLPIVAKERN